MDKVILCEFDPPILQPSRTATALEDLMGDMEDLYSAASTPGTLLGPGLVEGLHCAVKLDDDPNWYRAAVTSVGEGTVEVFLLDFGTKATVSSSPKRVRRLLEKFSRLALAGPGCPGSKGKAGAGTYPGADLVPSQLQEAAGADGDGLRQRGEGAGGGRWAGGPAGGLGAGWGGCGEAF